MNVRYLISDKGTFLGRIDPNSTYKNSRHDFIYDVECPSEKIPKEILESVLDSLGVSRDNLKTKSEMNEKISSILSNRKVKEIKMTDMTKAKEIMDSAIEAGQSEDEIKLALVRGGLSFKETNKFYKEYGTEIRFIVPVKELKENATQYLDDKLDGVETIDQESFDDLVSEMCDEIEGMDEVRATRMIRKACKDGEIELNLLKKSGNGGRTAKIEKWIAENPLSVDADFSKFMKSIFDDSEKCEKTTKRWAKVRRIVAASHAVSDDEVEYSDDEVEYESED